MDRIGEGRAQREGDRRWLGQVLGSPGTWLVAAPAAMTLMWLAAIVGAPTFLVVVAGIGFGICLVFSTLLLKDRAPRPSDPDRVLCAECHSVTRFSQRDCPDCGAPLPDRDRIAE